MTRGDTYRKNGGLEFPLLSLLERLLCGFGKTYVAEDVPVLLGKDTGGAGQKLTAIEMVVPAPRAIEKKHDAVATLARTRHCISSSRAMISTLERRNGGGAWITPIQTCRWIDNRQMRQGHTMHG